MKKTEEKRKQRWHEIRNAVLMLCLTVAMLSTATYAWFTLTDQPMVKGLKMTASAATGLKIAKSASDVFGQEITFEQEQEKKLIPVTNDGTGATFAEAKYTGDTVTDTTPVTDETELIQNYVAKYVYYLKADAVPAGGLKVGLVPESASGNAERGGSFVRTTASYPATASNAIRVGFLVNNQWSIFEPNKGNVNSGKSAPSTVGDPAAPNASQSGGTITYDSRGYLLMLNTTDPVKVEMYLWIEGKDASCVDEIQEDKLDAQIQFTVVN